MLFKNILDNTPFNKVHVKTILVSGSGFLTDAYDVFIISIITPMISQVYYEGKMDNNLQGLLKASASWGTLIGQLVFGFLSDRYGRKRIYGIELGVIILGTIGSALVGSTPIMSVVSMLILWRFVMGIGIGGDYPTSSVITSEFANKNNRGMMVASVFSMQGVGIVLAATVSTVLLLIFKSNIEASPNYYLDIVWRLCVAFGCIPGIFALYERLKLPESPRYSNDVNKNPVKALQDVNKFLNIQHNNNDNNNNNNNTPNSTISAETMISVYTNMTFYEYFGKWENFKVLFALSFSWFVLDIGYYGTNLNSNILLSNIGFGGGDTIFQKIFNIALGNLIATFLGSLPGYFLTILFIEKLGRRTIQFMGFAVLTIGFACLAGAYNWLIQYNVVLFVVLYTIIQLFNNFGPNATTFVIPSECFPTKFRGTANGIAAASGKLGAILAAQGFSTLKDIGGTNAFIPQLLWIFSGCMFLGLIATFWVPETKGRSLEEINGETPAPLQL